MTPTTQQDAARIRHHFEEMAKDKWPTISDRGRQLLAAFERVMVEWRDELAAVRKCDVAEPERQA